MKHKWMDVVKPCGFLVGWALVCGAFSLPALAEEDVSGYPELNLRTERGPSPPPHGRANFSEDRFSRIEEMRSWLAQRRLEREHAVIQAIQRVLPNTSMTVRPPVSQGDGGERQLLTPLGQRYAQGFESRRPTLPTLPMPRPYARTAPAVRSGWAPTPGSGFIASESKLYRIGTPAPPPSGNETPEDED